MEIKISATELARRFGDVLGRVRYRDDSFLVERNGEPVARLVPVAGQSATSLHEALAAWRAAAPPDPAFADELERIGLANEPAEPAWGS